MSEKPTILVVDDESELRQSICSLFKRKGFNALESSGGHEALEIVLKEKIDIVLSDIRMPNGDGIDLLEKIKDRNVERPPVILMTAFSDLMPIDAYQRGAMAMFTKPFDRSTLVQKVEEALKSRKEKWSKSPGPANHSSSLKIQFAVSDLKEALEAKIIQFGQGGMFLALADKLPSTDHEISFQIQFERGLPFSGCGVVRWSRRQSTVHLPPGIGVEFTFLNEEAKIPYFHMLERDQPKAYIPKGA